MEINNQPIVFNIAFTPYRLPRNATADERRKHLEARAFYDMTGEKNVYDYITTEGKRTGKLTALEYLQKNTGVFNQKGMIPQEQVDEMKSRLKENKGNIWHGFLSLNEEESHKIDTTEKCIALVKATFGAFLKEAHLNEKNIDLMCALHLDKPNHLHIHFVFWEKAPIYKGKDGTLRYRSKGPIDKAAIDNMFVRSGVFISDSRDNVYKTRGEALKKLRGMTAVKTAMHSSDDIRREIIALAKSLPKTGKLSYNNKEAAAYRGRVDKIVGMLLDYDGKAKRADARFYKALAEREAVIRNICGKPYAYSDRNMGLDELHRDLPTYHFKIDEKNIRIIEEIEADYKRRQGSLVLNLAKFIKPELFEKKPNKEYKPNDDFLKRRLNISRRKTDRAINKFIFSFGRESELLERDFTHRLQDIEEELKREREKEKEGNDKN